ncbi:hypothetical protein HOLleu_04182 [Holothuria leucospilota]|uniref:B box-type domain-containing protein n=1 Tax=Holothuria leucospilota TaxID=206669 RepID=A0A9Q1HM89_HOLLE|nr:hypothetical protein HOLleu_04182 [Holothuria leucospilota]
MGDELRKNLSKVAEVLTEEDVRDLVSNFEEIPVARQRSIRNSREFFAALQGHNLLGNRTISKLTTCMENMNLFKATKILQDHQKTCVEKEIQISEKCLQHPDQSLRYFCVTCTQKVCLECALHHSKVSNCDPVSVQEYVKFLQDRSKKLLAQLDWMRGVAKENESLLREKQELLFQIRNDEKQRVERVYKTLKEGLLLNKHDLLKKVNQYEREEEAAMNVFIEKTESMKVALAELPTRLFHVPENNSFSEFVSLSDNRRQVQSIVEQTKALSRKVVPSIYHLSYKSNVTSSNIGQIGIVKLSFLVGSIAHKKGQVIHMFDERKHNGKATFVCVDVGDYSNDFWRRRVDVGNRHCPIALSCLHVVLNGRQHVLFAIGNAVFTFDLLEEDPSNVSLQSVLFMVVNEAENQSWITTISTHQLTAGNSDHFLISISHSTLIRQYRFTRELLRTIETGDWASPIISTSYSPDMVAVITRACGDVSLLTTCNNFKQIGFLKPPINSPKLMPVCITWTTTTWLVVFAGRGEIKEWKVVQYAPTGNAIKVCAEATFYSYVGVPVSLTTLGGFGFLSFPDGSVRTFKY